MRSAVYAATRADHSSGVRVPPSRLRSMSGTTNITGPPPQGVLEPALGIARHRHAAQAINLDGNLCLAVGPQAKARMVGIDQGGAERQLAREAGHGDRSLRLLKVSTMLRGPIIRSSLLR